MYTNLKFTRKIEEIEYDDENSVLTLHFNTSLIKRYFDVPQRIYNNLQRSMDKDQFYQTVIDGAFCVEWLNARKTALSKIAFY